MKLRGVRMWLELVEMCASWFWGEVTGYLSNTLLSGDCNSHQGTLLAFVNALVKMAAPMNGIHNRS